MLSRYQNRILHDVDSAERKTSQVIIAVQSGTAGSQAVKSQLAQSQAVAQTYLGQTKITEENIQEAIKSLIRKTVWDKWNSLETQVEEMTQHSDKVVGSGK